MSTPAMLRPPPGTGVYGCACCSFALTNNTGRRHCPQDGAPLRELSGPEALAILRDQLDGRTSQLLAGARHIYRLEGALKRCHDLLAEAQARTNPQDHATWTTAVARELAPCDQGLCPAVPGDEADRGKAGRPKSDRRFRVGLSFVAGGLGGALIAFAIGGARPAAAVLGTWFVLLGVLAVGAARDRRSS